MYNSPSPTFSICGSQSQSRYWMFGSRCSVATNISPSVLFSNPSFIFTIWYLGLFKQTQIAELTGSGGSALHSCTRCVQYYCEGNTGDEATITRYSVIRENLRTDPTGAVDILRDQAEERPPHWTTTLNPNQCLLHN